MSGVSKLIYRLNMILINITARCFEDGDKLLKFVFKAKEKFKWKKSLYPISRCIM